MINAIRVRNLRAILDSGNIQFKKINVLVGKNSAGKSTLLRVFPLLRQSVEKPTKGPLLWYGRLVDFGGYQNAVNSSNKAEGINIEFDLSLHGGTSYEVHDEPDMLVPGGDLAHFHGALPGVKAVISIGRDENDEVGAVRYVSINLGADSVKVDLSGGSTKISVNNEAISLPSGKRWSLGGGKIIPILNVAREHRTETGVSYLIHEYSPFFDRLLSSMRGLFHHNTGEESISEICGSLLYADEASFYAQLRELGGTYSTFLHKIDLLNKNSAAVVAIRRAVLLTSLSGIFRRIDKEIYDFANEIKYVEPVRATAERYYRLQDLSVDEIDSRGENVAMLLSSLSDSEKRRLRTWMLDNLGFYAYVSQGTGHVEVKISTKSDEGKNIADLGFGYSQLLPIVLQVWRGFVDAKTFGLRRAARRKVLAIEQPELHLHPQFQAKIADVLVAAFGRQNVSGSARPLRGDVANASVFMETHSEHIVNRLGYLVSKGRISKEDVQVIMVDSESGAGATVKVVGFDNDGYLDANWPVGFFVPEVDE